jgi:DNA-binding transcriptional LysR family regulator
VSFERSLEQRKITPNIIEFSSITSLHKCLILGIGITICPEIAVEKAITDGRLLKLNCNIEVCETPVIMIWHSEKWCSPLLTQFMALCEAIICD